MHMTRAGKIIVALFCGSVCVSGWFALLFMQGLLHQPTPAELYRALSEHIRDCREKDFVGAYEDVAVRFQNRMTLVEFERGLHADPARTSNRMRVEYGPVRPFRDAALVEVYFVAPDGGVVPRLYLLVREGRTWKIAMVERFEEWIDGSRVRGVRC